MRKEIKYIGFYDLPGAKGSRVSTLAAINKMDYIAEAIIQTGYDVNIVSPSWSSGNGERTTAQQGGSIQIHSHKKVTFCPTFNTENKLTGYLKIIYSLIWLFFWLVKNVKRNEKILLYHVQWLSLPVRWAKKIKGFKLVLEVEEFYNKIWENKNILKVWENKIIENADYYIAVSDVLAEILGPKVKAVVYGNYLLPKLSNSKQFLKNEKINVVYAGSIDDTKGGAFKAVDCALLLPDPYLMHISGPGDKNSQKKLVEKINELNNNLGRVACIYHGVIKEDVFADFLQSCQIALNPQFLGEKFRYLFPSKIIKYMANNLSIVSTAIESIEKSKVSDFIIFTDGDQPKDFVRAILSINFELPSNNASEIRKLNDDFVINIKKLLSDTDV